MDEWAVLEAPPQGGDWTSLGASVDLIRPSKKVRPPSLIKIDVALLILDNWGTTDQHLGRCSLLMSL